jgi:hypothetical protein
LYKVDGVIKASLPLDLVQFHPCQQAANIQTSKNDKLALIDNIRPSIQFEVSYKLGLVEIIEGLIQIVQEIRPDSSSTGNKQNQFQA